MPTPVSLTLLTKPGCHLCDDARAVVDAVRVEAADRGIETTLEVTDILSDPELARLHAEDIPVLFVAGRRHAIWRVDPTRLSAAIEQAARPRGLLRRPRR